MLVLYRIVSLALEDPVDMNTIEPRAVVGLMNLLSNFAAVCAFSKWTRTSG